MKKMKYLFVLAFVFVMGNLTAFAQNPGDFDDPADPNPTDAPIEDYLWVVALIGLMFVFYKLKSKQVKSV